jgi:HAMP domain-containing protein
MAEDVGMPKWLMLVAMIFVVSLALGITAAFSILRRTRYSDELTALRDEVDALRGEVKRLRGQIEHLTGSPERASEAIKRNF